VLAMIALLIGYEAVSRLIWPVPISFDEAIPIAFLGLGVNVASVLLLSGGGHQHHHGHGYNPSGRDHRHDDAHRIEAGGGVLLFRICEEGLPPRFRLSSESSLSLRSNEVTIETMRPGGARQLFAMADRGGYLESVDEVPEPHEFAALVRLNRGADVYSVAFQEHEHAHSAADRDNNMRAAIIHVLADAAVSILVIVGLLLGRFLGWIWMDPVAGMCGAIVIAAWSYGLVRDTGAILLDMNPDREMTDRMRAMIEADGDQLTDLHLWRLGPGHLGAVLSIATQKQRGPEYYQSLLGRFRTLSHMTVQIQHR
jgi:cation diffusion facilitator family transporter